MSIIPIRSLSEIDFTNIDENTLVIWDLDDTTFVPKNRVMRNINNQYKKSLLSQLSNEEISQLYQNYKNILIEPILVEIIKDLIYKNIPTIALTTRETGYRLQTCSTTFQEQTLKSLNELNIKFLSHYNDQNFQSIHSNNNNYNDNVVFTNNISKGVLLKELFSIWKPSYIIMIDDKLSNLNELSKFDINYTGYLYSGFEDIDNSVDDSMVNEYINKIKNGNY